MHPYSLIHNHEYMIFYSIINNLLLTIQAYDMEADNETSKLDELPEGVRSWIVDYIAQCNSMPDNMFDDVTEYFEKSLKKETKFHKETTFQ